jgi:hypothetical protein
MIHACIHVIPLRNGLAQRALDLKKRAQTDLTLWHKEIETAFASSSLRGVAPDLRLRIIKILSLPAGAKPSSPRKPTASSSVTSTSCSPGLAICSIIHPVSSATTTNGQQMKLNPQPIPRTLAHGQDQLVVLSFPRLAPSRGRGQMTRLYARNPEDFVVGREVYVWEPWHEVVLTPVTEPNQLKVESEYPDKPQPAPFPTLPATFPSTFSPTPYPTNMIRPVGDVALLCSRFVILPG